MGIYVRGVKYPGNCFRCPASSYHDVGGEKYGYLCKFLSDGKVVTSVAARRGRRIDCPIRFIPEEFCEEQPMFSSNQRFQVSCTKEQLSGVLALVLDMYHLSGGKPVQLAYQVVGNTLVIGRMPDSGSGKWKPITGNDIFVTFVNSFDVDILEPFVINTIQNMYNNGYIPQPISGDGSVKHGYMVESLPLSFSEKSEDGIVEPWFGIFTVKPFELFYHK